MKRILVHTLPLCLIWALFACVFVCASHVEEVRGENASYPLPASLTTLDTDCCPIIKATGERPE
jgi:hypothetical protein